MWQVGTRLVVAALLCCFGTRVSQATSSEAPKPIKVLRLQAFFHTAQPWRLEIYPPQTGADGFNVSDIRGCFVGPTTDCQTIAHDSFSSLKSAKLEMLAGAQRGTERPAVVIRATHSAGTVNSSFTDIDVWVFIRSTGANLGGSFVRVFHYPGFFGGEYEFVKSGPLAGAFVAVWQPFTANAPVRYRIEVYEPTKYSYVRILGLLSTKRYPSINYGGEPSDPISVLMPEILRAVHAVYPQGIPQPRV